MFFFARHRSLILDLFHLQRPPLVMGHQAFELCFLWFSTVRYISFGSEISGYGGVD